MEVSHSEPDNIWHLKVSEKLEIDMWLPFTITTEVYASMILLQIVVSDLCRNMSVPSLFLLRGELTVYLA